VQSVSLALPPRASQATDWGSGLSTWSPRASVQRAGSRTSSRRSGVGQVVWNPP
jgi:hypothetical protein